MTLRRSVPCPHCGYMTNAQMGIAKKGDPRAEERPKPGSVSICIKCAGVAVFTEGMGQRKMTYIEELGFDADTKQLIAHARASVRQLPPRPTTADGRRGKV